jgi:glucose/arabinose dehydrogenase
VIEIQKASHHNTGGMLLFGPDGLLHIGVGDDDSEALGQDLSVLNGKLLRIFVDPSAGGYAVPLNNPFGDVVGVRPEIWAYGLREPYRFWFDESDLYIADVGDNQREEIDVIPAGTRGGQNFGWPIMEGSICHTPASGCDKTGLVLPAYEYPHDGGTAVTGTGRSLDRTRSTMNVGAPFIRVRFGDFPSRPRSATVCASLRCFAGSAELLTNRR